MKDKKKVEIELMKRMLEDKFDIPDDEVKDAITGYEFILPGDRVELVLAASKVDEQPDLWNVKYIEGELLSTVPVYMVKTGDGKKHSLNYNYVMDVILVEKNEERNFIRAMELRVQMRKMMVLNAVLTGGAVSKSAVQKEQQGYYQ